MDVYGQTRKQIIQLLWDSNAEDITGKCKCDEDNQQKQTPKK